VEFFAGGLFLVALPQRIAIVTPSTDTNQPMHRKLNTVYRLALRQEIRDRLSLARHAKRHGLRVARLWHVEQAAAARRKLRNLPKP
jgi:hypothetical protein